MPGIVVFEPGPRRRSPADGGRERCARRGCPQAAETRYLRNLSLDDHAAAADAVLERVEVAAAVNAVGLEARDLGDPQSRLGAHGCR